MKKEEITKKVISYIQLSTMDDREKAMWMLLLPHMEEQHVIKLKDTLEKEVNSLMDLYLKVTKTA
jgi:hypothetical protein